MTRDDLIIVAEMIKTITASPKMIDSIKQKSWDEVYEVLAENLLEEGNE